MSSARVVPVARGSAGAETAVDTSSQSGGEMAVERIQPAGLSKPTAYSHVVSVTSGRIVFIAGQIPVDAAGNVVGVGDFRAQVVQVHENLKAALAAVGATFDNLVKIVQYIPNYDPAVHRPALG